MTSKPRSEEDSQGHLKVEAGCREFLSQFDYNTELGVFAATWKVYKELPLEDFEEAKPKKDRMLLPGMEVTPDLIDSVIRTFAAVWQFAARDETKLSMGYISTYTSQQALKLGATPALADQLARFLPDYCTREIASD